MNCFYHVDRPAVGICKSCSKGLCSECAIDTGKGIACKGKCAERVIEVENLIDRNLAARLMGEGQLKQNLYFMLFMGMMSGLLGGLMIKDEHTETGVLFIVFGVVVAIRGVLHYFKWIRLHKLKN